MSQSPPHDFYHGIPPENPVTPERREGPENSDPPVVPSESMACANDNAAPRKETHGEPTTLRSQTARRSNDAAGCFGALRSVRVEPGSPSTSSAPIHGRAGRKTPEWRPKTRRRRVAPLVEANGESNRNDSDVNETAKGDDADSTYAEIYRLLPTARDQEDDNNRDNSNDNQNKNNYDNPLRLELDSFHLSEFDVSANNDQKPKKSGKKTPTAAAKDRSPMPFNNEREFHRPGKDAVGYYDAFNSANRSHSTFDGTATSDFEDSRPEMTKEEAGTLIIAFGMYIRKENQSNSLILIRFYSKRIILSSCFSYGPEYRVHLIF